MLSKGRLLGGRAGAKSSNLRKKARKKVNYFNTLAIVLGVKCALYQPTPGMIELLPRQSPKQYASIM